MATDQPLLTNWAIPGTLVYQENMLCPIIYLHIYSWEILKLSDFMFLQGGGTCHFLILQGGGTCG